jgi:hypothetical protein
MKEKYEKYDIDPDLQSISHSSSVIVCVSFRHILKGPRQKIETENKIKSRNQRAEVLHAQCDEYKRRKIRMKRASKAKEECRGRQSNGL